MHDFNKRFPRGHANDTCNAAEDLLASYNAWIWAKIKKKMGGWKSWKKLGGSNGNILFFWFNTFIETIFYIDYKYVEECQYKYFLIARAAKNFQNIIPKYPKFLMYAYVRTFSSKLWFRVHLPSEQSKNKTF